MKKYLFLIAFFLVACEPNEMYPAGVGAGVAGSGGRNGGSYSAPTSQQVPVKPFQIEASPSPIQEVHGVVNRQNCYNMEAKFQRQGRRIKLVRVEQSTNPGATLQYICIFEGEDAEQGYFEDNRY